MGETAQAFRLRRRADPMSEERRQLLESMADTRRALNQAYNSFNTHSDPDLVESCVYEINALQSRYAYLARQMKELEHRAAAEAAT